MRGAGASAGLSGLGVALLLGLLASLPVARLVEGRVGLPALYALRGDQAAPIVGARLVLLDAAEIDALKFNAPEMARVYPRLAACLPEVARDEVRRARNVSDLPRDFHACLVQELARRGAAAVVFDIFFTETRTLEGDARLKAALTTAPQVILLERIGPHPRLGLVPVRQRPESAFAAAVGDARLGFFVLAEQEGAWVWRTGFGEFPEARSLPVQALRLVRGAEVQTPADPAQLWLYGPPGTVPRVTLADLFGASETRVFLKGQAVFVGEDARDRFTTALSLPERAHPGVELAATAYLNLMTGTVPQRSPATVDALASALMFGAGLWITGGVGRRVAAARALILGLIWAIAATFAFLAWQVWLPLVLPLALALPLALLWSVLRLQGRLGDLLSRFLPGPVARRIEAEGVRTGMVEEPATLILVDMIGSTALATQLSATAFQQETEALFALVIEAVEGQGGYVVKETGDGALCALPLSACGATHADRAMAAARTMLESLGTLRAERLAGGAPVFGVRVMLHSGPVSIGVFSAAGRFGFDVFGDTVNVVSRLEERAKQLFPGDSDVVLVTRDLILSLTVIPDTLVALGEQTLRGRVVPISVYRWTFESDAA